MDGQKDRWFCCKQPARVKSQKYKYIFFFKSCFSSPAYPNLEYLNFISVAFSRFFFPRQCGSLVHSKSRTTWSWTDELHRWQVLCVLPRLSPVKYDRATNLSECFMDTDSSSCLWTKWSLQMQSNQCSLEIRRLCQQAAWSFVLFHRYKWISLADTRLWLPKALQQDYNHRTPSGRLSQWTERHCWGFSRYQPWVWIFPDAFIDLTYGRLTQRYVCVLVIS